MDSSKKTTVNKNRFKGGLHGRIFLKINTTFHTLYWQYSFVYTERKFSKTNTLDLSFLFVFLPR